jgi:hypothetical protein
LRPAGMILRRGGRRWAFGALWSGARVLASPELARSAHDKSRWHPHPDSPFSPREASPWGPKSFPPIFSPSPYTVQKEHIPACGPGGRLKRKNANGPLTHGAKLPAAKTGLLHVGSDSVCRRSPSSALGTISRRGPPAPRWPQVGVWALWSGARVLASPELARSAHDKSGWYPHPEILFSPPEASPWGPKSFFPNFAPFPYTRAR